MERNEELAKGFSDLFKGMDRVYGTYELTGNKNSYGKAEGVAVTKFEKVNSSIWLNHLLGVKGVGIVPITDESTCCWGAIDIDNYIDFDVKMLLNKIEELKLPLIVCRSKSGGAHVYCFLKEFILASVMQEKLREFASALGYSKNNDGRSVEIFPIQSKVQASRGDIGSWINMPYFGALSDNTTNRYAYNKNGEPLHINDFILFASKIAVTYEELSAIKFELDVKDFDGAPPCIQLIIKQKCAVGSRNNFMYALGVFAKKKFEDTWERKIEEWNYKYLEVPLASTEIQATIKSLRRKDYMYPCSKEPIQGYCNGSLCRTRKYGVGDTSSFPELNALTKLMTSPPTFFWSGTHNNKPFSLELTTSELQSPTLFQKKCIEHLNFMPQIPKKDTWQMIVQAALDNVHEIDMPEDSSSIGQLLYHLEKFCTSRAAAKTKEELLLGKPYNDGTRTYFKMTDFTDYLSRNNYKEFKPHQISAIIKENKNLKCKHVFLNIKGKGLNLWSIESYVKLELKVDIPDEIQNNESPY